MPEPGFAARHGVLVVSKAWENICEEVAGEVFGLLEVGRPPKGVKLAEPIRRQGRDLGDQPLRHRIGRDDQPLRSAGPLGQPSTVLRVEVPAPSGRLIPLHEDPVSTAHVAVEELHAKLPPPLGPALEGLGVTEVAIIGQAPDRRGQADLEIIERPFQTPLA